MKARKLINRLAAMQRVELYFMSHPGSPSAVRQPQLSLRGKTWRAVLGSNARDRITGFGSTVEEALSNFDTQYLRALRPPEEFEESKYAEPCTAL